MTKDNEPKSNESRIAEYPYTYLKDDEPKKKGLISAKASRISRSTMMVFFVPLVFLVPTLCGAFWLTFELMETVKETLSPDLLDLMDLDLTVWGIVSSSPLIPIGGVVYFIGVLGGVLGRGIGKSINKNKGEIPGAVIGGILLTILGILSAFTTLMLFTWLMSEEPPQPFFEWLMN